MQMPLWIILAEAALELVPKSILGHPSVLAHSKRRGREPNETLLDVSYHYAAMKRLKQFEKRGRPDIAHFSILEALGSPLNKEGQLETWIHTVQDQVIRVDPKTRVPRNYDRFLGLMEQLFKEKRVPPQGRPLLQLETLPLQTLVERIRSAMVIVLSTLGKPSTFEEIGRSLARIHRPVVIVGGFARGHLSERNIKLADQVLSVDRAPLDSWLVTSRIIYEYECGLKDFHKCRITGRPYRPNVT